MKLGPETWHAMPQIRRELIVKSLGSPYFPDDPPELLFHYTAPDACSAIIEKHAIWLTNAAYLNDQGELEYPVELARSVVEERTQSAANDATRSFLAAVTRALGSHTAYKSWYIASLSTEGDLLSQWRAYCPKGGYSLGLVGARLVSILLGQGGFDLRPVVYKEDRQREIVHRILAKFLDIHAEMAAKYPDMKRSELDLEVASALWFMLSREFVTFKAPAFEEEHEWRIAHYDDDDDCLQFRERQGLLTPFLTLDLADDDGKLPLGRVHTSPLVDNELAKHAATLLLEQHKYDRASELIRTPAYRLRF